MQPEGTNTFGFGTDFHGNLQNIDRFLRESQERDVRHVIFGGDIAPKKMGITLQGGKGVRHTDVAAFQFDNQLPPQLSEQELYETGFIPFEIKIPAEDFNLLLSLFKKFGEQAACNSIGITLEEINVLEKNKQLLIDFFVLDPNGQNIFEYYERRIKEVKYKLDLTPENLVNCIIIHLKFELSKRAADEKERAKILFGTEKYDRNKHVQMFSDISLLESVVGFKKVLDIIGKCIIHEYLDRINHEFEQYSVPGQKRFTEDLIRRIRQFRESFHGSVSLILGNDDQEELLDIFEEADREGIITNATGRVSTLDDQTEILGYSFVPPLPEVSYQRWFKEEGAIREDLERIVSEITGTRVLIANIHCPPFGTFISKARISSVSGEEFGSTAVRRLIEVHRPAVGLHGHLHLPYMITGQVHDQIGKTVIFNPGASEYNPRFIFGDIANPLQYNLLFLQQQE